MTKGREHEAKRHLIKAKPKEKSKHEQVREAHVEEKLESEPTESPKKHEDVNQAAARLVGEATSPTERRTLTVQPDAEIQEQIRVRAFKIFEQRGQQEGHDLDDWLQAEAELTAEQWRVLAA